MGLISCIICFAAAFTAVQTQDRNDAFGKLLKRFELMETPTTVFVPPGWMKGAVPKKQAEPVTRQLAPLLPRGTRVMAGDKPEITPLGRVFINGHHLLVVCRHVPQDFSFKNEARTQKGTMTSEIYAPEEGFVCYLLSFSPEGGFIDRIVIAFSLWQEWSQHAARSTIGADGTMIMEYAEANCFTYDSSYGCDEQPLVLYRSRIEVTATGKFEQDQSRQVNFTGNFRVAGGDKAVLVFDFPEDVRDWFRPDKASGPAKLRILVMSGGRSRVLRVLSTDAKRNIIKARGASPSLTHGLRFSEDRQSLLWDPPGTRPIRLERSLH